MENSYLIIELICVIAGFVIGKFFIPTQTGQKTIEVIETVGLWATQFIHYCNQYINKTGPEKMDYVITELVKICEKEKIQISEEQLELLLKKHMILLKMDLLMRQNKEWY